MTTIVEPHLAERTHCYDDPADPERCCHIFSDTWPIALCGFNLTGRTPHNLDVCRIQSHAMCEVCLELG